MQDRPPYGAGYKSGGAPTDYDRPTGPADLRGPSPQIYDVSLPSGTGTGGVPPQVRQILDGLPVGTHRYLGIIPKAMPRERP